MAALNKNVAMYWWNAWFTYLERERWFISMNDAMLLGFDFDVLNAQTQKLERRDISINNLKNCARIHCSWMSTVQCWSKIDHSIFGFVREFCWAKILQHWIDMGQQYKSVDTNGIPCDAEKSRKIGHWMERFVEIWGFWSCKFAGTWIG